MTPDQTSLALMSTCRGCGADLPYGGVGRPRVYCDECLPPHYPARQKVSERTRPLVRRTDPDTSRQAAASVNGAAVESLILEAFELFGALTDDELVDVLDGPHGPTVKSARSRLSKAGCLVDSGMRRPSNRGRAMIVFEVVR